MKVQVSGILRHRKVLLLGPLIVVPLIALFVWCASKIIDGSYISTTASQGFNLNLPGAHIKEGKRLDKMAYYKKAEEDSVRLQNRLRNGTPLYSPSDTSSSPDQAEVRLNRKVAELKGLLNGQSPPAIPETRPEDWRTDSWRSYERLPSLNESAPPRKTPPISGSDVDRLERLMKTMKEGGAESSPEMRELNQTLDKLVLLQHPERTKDTSSQKQASATPLPVDPAQTPEVINTWQKQPIQTNRFYDLETNDEEDDIPTALMIEAVIAETQTMINGSILRMELSTELIIKGDHIPKGTPIYGLAQLSNQRLLVKISAIRCREKVYPVALQVLDLDGMPGIFEPESMEREAVRESAGTSIGTIGPASLDPSIGGQATNAGIQLARSLTSRKFRQVRVTVKTGYHIFLEDMSQKH
ncbi:MAG: conjugative transposon protein TraM [Bacteroidetes bacterium]|nr:conjugative transposon protein TraM [Bacteroidota bacterium]